jgi:hypothetical protein
LASEHTFVQPFFLSQSCAAAGDLEGAMDWLERGYRERDPVVVLNHWPHFIPGYREHPRFRAVMERARVPLASDLQQP